MKKIILFILFIICVHCSFSQAIFKGLEYGMSQRDAKKEFKNNKAEYDAVDFGNGFVWRVFQQNFIYANGGLAGVLFQPKAALMGLSHDGATSYLEFSRAFFEAKGYTVFFEPEYWQYPVNFRSKYGLLMHDADKTIVVQLYPYYSQSGGQTFYNAYMKVLNFNWFMDEYRKQTEILEDKSKKSGF